MASRKEQKEQARARRLAEEQAAAGRARKRRRMEMLGGVVIVAVVIVVIAIAVSAGGSSTGPLNAKAARTAEAQVSNLLKGIPQSGTTLGNPSAPVTLTYFGDLECPVCQAFTLGIDGGGFPQLISNEVRSGKVKVVYRSFCTATCNNAGQSVFNEQQTAAYAAGKQNLFWNYAELFYREQGSETSGYVTPAFLQSLASHTQGLNLTSWQSQRGDPSVLGQVQADEAAAAAEGLSGTPTLIFKGPKGTEPAQASIPTYGQLQSTINAVE